MENLASNVGDVLKSRGWMMATAESCTGGGVAQAVTDIAGSSAWFDRGFITYSNLSKQQMLGVNEPTLLQYGAVSEATVREMVAGALRRSSAQVVVAISGIAGPGGGTAEKPVGTIWFAWGIQDSPVVSRKYLLNGQRTEIRQQAVNIALQGVLEIVMQHREVA